jgi:hypothetical protein
VDDRVRGAGSCSRLSRNARCSRRAAVNAGAIRRSTRWGVVGQPQEVSPLLANPIQRAALCGQTPKQLLNNISRISLVAGQIEDKREQSLPMVIIEPLQFAWYHLQLRRTASADLSMRLKPRYPGAIKPKADARKKRMLISVGSRNQFGILYQRAELFLGGAVMNPLVRLQIRNVLVLHGESFQNDDAGVVFAQIPELTLLQFHTVQVVRAHIAALKKRPLRGLASRESLLEVRVL